MEGSNHSIIWDSILVSTGWTDKNTRTFCRIVRLLGEIPPKTWIQCRRDNHLRSMFVCFWCNSPQWARASSFTRFLDHTQRRTTVDRTPLDEWSARRRDLYLTTHNTHNRHTSMPPVGFEPTISAGERPQTYALDRSTTGTSCLSSLLVLNVHVGWNILEMLAQLLACRIIFMYDWKCLKNHGNFFSEPNNDSPMNTQAAALWSDKAEMRQRVLSEHKKSESQWNWQVTSEFKITLSETDILKFSPTFSIMWTSILRVCTVTSKKRTQQAFEACHCICWFNIVFIVFRVIYFHLGKSLQGKHSSAWILCLRWLRIAADYNMNVACWIWIRTVFW